MKYLTSLTLLTALSATQALAHPGHLAPVGHGHSHWLEYGVLVGLAVITVGTMVMRKARSRH